MPDYLTLSNTLLGSKQPNYAQKGPFLGVQEVGETDCYDPMVELRNGKSCILEHCEANPN
jgi:hypothetical protein